MPDDRRSDITTETTAVVHEPIRHYEIRVEGRLTPRWSAWFEGLTVETDASDGTTVISGAVVDQAALHGLLQKLRDVGLVLVSLAEVPPTDLKAPIVPPCGDAQARRIP